MFCQFLPHLVKDFLAFTPICNLLRRSEPSGIRGGPCRSFPFWGVKPHLAELAKSSTPQIFEKCSNTLKSQNWAAKTNSSNICWSAACMSVPPLLRSWPQATNPWPRRPPAAKFRWFFLSLFLSFSSSPATAALPLVVPSPRCSSHRLRPRVKLHHAQRNTYREEKFTYMKKAWKSGRIPDSS